MIAGKPPMAGNLKASSFRRVLWTFLWPVFMAGLLPACEEEKIQGVLVAKFVDDSARFVKRIVISTLDGPALTVALVTKSKSCQLIAFVPSGAFSEARDCTGIQGIASLRCEGNKEIPSHWKMTSCHSGYGRSLAGLEPAFIFGFSGNTYTAQNQLELAQRASFTFPGNECPESSESNNIGDCKAPNTLPPPVFP